MKNLYLFTIATAITMLAYTQNANQLLEMNHFPEAITCCYEGEIKVIDLDENRRTLGQPPAGNGNQESPFLISNSYNLIWFFENSHHWDKFYRQTHDIDATEPAFWFGGTGWIPIGTEANPFTGNYDGNNKVITNLMINRDTPQYQGFFGWNNGVIKNLGIVDAHITDNGSRAGILVGLNNNGTVDNCFSTGLIESTSMDGRIGGLVGWNYSTISNSWSSATVNASNGILVGGLAGANSGGTVTNCYATGNVHGAISVGGLLGTIQLSGMVEGCFASGNIIAHRMGGGLVGYNNISNITNCYASGNIALDYYGGGLVGSMLGGSIARSYALGSIYSFYNHDHLLGGLLGNAQDVTIFFSYWNVETSGHLTSKGGLPATTQQMITQSFYQGWDFENIWQIIENQTYPYFNYQNEPMDINYPPLVLAPGNFWATPDDSKIMLQWQAPSMDAHVGFKLYRDNLLFQVLNAASVHYLDNNTENLKYHTYHISAMYGTNEESLKLGINVFATPGIAFGSGSEEDPYQISDLSDLFTVRLEPGAYYLQVDNIDLSTSIFQENEGWLPIGDYVTPFSGKYDGDGFIISNLYINKPDGYIMGLFGQIREATITNVHLVDVSITSYASSGGVAGSVYYSMISDCSVTGNIQTGWIDAGGLVGSCYFSTISGCFSTADVSCLINWAGGLLGSQAGGVTINSYASGTTTGMGVSGGLIGGVSSGGQIKNSYSKGTVLGNNFRGGLLGIGDASMIIENCYWDIETSGIGTSAGGTGINTLDMLLQESFENWDFENTWSIEQGKTYPYLSWQHIPGEHNVAPGWYLLSTRIYPRGAGAAQGAGVYAENDQVMVSATAFDGFIFEYWLDGEGNLVTDQNYFHYTMADYHVQFTAIFSNVTQIDNWTLEFPQVFPNPFSDIIKINNASSLKGVVMTNILGQVLLQRSLSGSETEIMFTPDLAPGIYLISLIDINNNRKVVKLVKR
jgi:hypothetical protein